MKKIIRVGSVGLGGIWNGPHAKGIAKSPDLQLVALCDIDAEKLKAAAEKYGIDEAHCFTDYRALIRCPEVDAVDICTPNDVHYEIAMAAAEAKKPFTVEKPITMTAEQADRLYACAKENDVKNMVCFSYRFKSAARYAKDLIAQGLLGEIYHVNAQYFQAWGLPRAECPLVWRYIKERTGSGALGDLGCHALDLVRFITGDEYTRVVSHTGTFVKERKTLDGKGVGTVDVDDFCNYMADTKKGASVSFQITRFAYGRGNYQRVEIYGSQGALVYHLDEDGDGVDTLEYCDGEMGAMTHVYAKMPIPEQYTVEQMQSFADIVNDCGDGLAATLYDGKMNQHVVDALLHSAESGTWVTTGEEN